MLRKGLTSLRALYRTLELPGANPLKDAHAALDAAVLAAYGFSTKKDLLAQPRIRIRPDQSESNQIKPVEPNRVAGEIPP